jgi:hypothetical protein
LIVLRPLLRLTPPLPVVLPVVPESVPTDPVPTDPVPVAPPPTEPVPADPAPAEPAPELPDPPIIGATESRPLASAPPAVCASAGPARPIESSDIAMNLQGMIFSMLVVSREKTSLVGALFLS